MRNRASNIELLRIVAMFMIVIHHIIVHGIGSTNIGNNLSIQILDSFAIFGVNLFVLISGYFTIKLCWKSYLSLIFTIGFYKLAHLCVDTFYLGINHSVFEWIAKPLSGPVSGGGWFMDVYLLLMLISPLVNKCLSNLTKREYHIGLILILIIDCVYGFGIGALFDSYGYSMMHFISLYYLGYGLSHFIKGSSRMYTLLFIITICITSLCIFLNLPMKFSSYANPLVILSSVCIFKLFANTDIHSNKIINRIAMSMLPVYLLSDSGNISNYCYEMIGRWYVSLSTLEFLGHVTLCIVILFTTALAIDQIRILLSPYIVKPIAKTANKVSNNIIDKLS